METRFGLKDFFLLLLVLVLIVMVGLAMVQYDRQYVVLKSINDQMASQTRELAAIHTTLENGVVAAPAGGAGGPTTNAATAAAGLEDPFKYVKEARKNPDYALGDWYITNFGTTVNKLTPLVADDLYAVVVQNRICETLLTRDVNTLKYVPLLARSWQVSPDGLTITMQLRRGVTFSDGSPFTADDVIFTFDWLMNPAVACPRARSTMDKMKGYRKINDYEVEFTFKEPYYEALALAGETNVMSKKFYSQYKPEEFNQSTGLLMGTGPYRMPDPKGWRPGQQIELVRNERYWGEPGPFNKLVYLQVQEEAAEATMFRNGEMDNFGPPNPELYVRMLKDPAITARANSYEYESVLSGYSYIAWNEVKGGKPTRWSDKRVRQAMTYLLDRERICKEIYLGYAKVQSGPFARLSRATDPSVQPYPYDPEKAKALLKGAGFEDRNGDGVIESPAGEPFRFKITYPAASAIYGRVMQFMKDGYAKAGVAVELDPVDWPILQKKCREHDFDAISLGWATTIESDIYQMFHSSQIADQADDFMSYKNPELDKAIEEARSTVDEERRMELWHKCHRIIAEDQPYTFMVNRTSTVFYDKRIKNIQKSKLGLNYAQQYVISCPWYVPQAEQKYR